MKEVKDIKNILIIGCGTLGLRIGLRCAMDGYNVRMYDISDKILERARVTQDKLLSSFIKRNIITEAQADSAKERISTTTDVGKAVKNIDLVSESVTEDIDLKKKVYQAFAPHFEKHTIVTTNTSYLLASMLAGDSGCGERFCAFHFHDVFFMNVVDIMPHPNTEEWVSDLLLAFGKTINQIPVYIKNENNGYIFNQMLLALLGSAGDQASWESGLDEAARHGLDVSKEPRAFDKKYRDALLARTLTYQDQLNNQFREKQLESSAADRKEARDERRFQSGIKMDEKMQGLKTPYGLANTVDDAKQLKEGHESKKNFDNKLDQMIALRENHSGGAIFNRDDVGVGQQLSKDLLLEYKNMAKLGVLSQADEAIINAIIPKDPLEYNSPLAAIQGQDPVMSKLKTFRENANKDFQNRVNTRTRAGIENSGKSSVPDQASANQNHSQAIQWAQANPNDPRAKKILQINQATAKVGQ